MKHNKRNSETLREIGRHWETLGDIEWHLETLKDIQRHSETIYLDFLTKCYWLSDRTDYRDAIASKKSSYFPTTIQSNDVTMDQVNMQIRKRSYCLERLIALAHLHPCIWPKHCKLSTFPCKLLSKENCYMDE